MGEWGFVRRWLSRGALCVLAALISVVAGPATQVFASETVSSETHVFDPQLSLTGNCKATTPDPVPDPGCPEGAHPPKAFSRPDAVAIDSHGDMFVASFGQSVEGTEGRVDIFNSAGVFISELAMPGSEDAAPENIAVDSKGNLYISEDSGQVRRFPPAVYEPASGKIEYTSSPTVVNMHTSASTGQPKKAIHISKASKKVSTVPPFQPASRSMPNTGEST
jgi:hypothetical protein